MPTLPRERRYGGASLARGVALGRACLLVPSEVSSRVTETGSRGVDAEVERTRGALERLVARLDRLARYVDCTLGPEEAAIFESQRMMLEDETLRGALARAVAEPGATAERAVSIAFGQFRGWLLGAGSEVIRERAGDIAECERNLLTELGHAPPLRRCRQLTGCPVALCRLRNPHILVVPELTPALVMEVDELTVGFLAGHGGPTSHAAILARASGLPAVRLDGLWERVPIEADLLIDADRGEVIVSPGAETLVAYRDRLAVGPRTVSVTHPVPGLQVLANIDRVSEVDEALAAQAEGVGLYRTEVEALRLGRPLAEEEQYERYAAAARAMGERPLYVRLLDFGGDKTADFLGLPSESNPALGLRGARLLLARPRLLRAQARALARASVHGNLRVIAPMVVDIAQFLRLKVIVNEEAATLGAPPPLLGAMLEVPSACLQARPILAAADFACVGTNDLIQFLFAMDRSNGEMITAELHEHPVIWAMLEDLAHASRESGRPLCVCGDLAGDPALTGRLIRAGIRHLSVTPRAIADVRAAARSELAPSR